MVNINKKKLTFILLIAIFLVFLEFFLLKNISNNDFRPEDVKNIKIGEQIIKIDIASTPETQEKGLSGRKEIKNDEGMIFIFPNPGKYSFWMKDMNFPIDIIWLDEDFRIVFIEKKISPDTYPETFTPKNDSKYVLEVIAGFSEKNNLKEGDIAQFLP